MAQDSPLLRIHAPAAYRPSMDIKARKLRAFRMRAVV